MQGKNDVLVEVKNGWRREALDWRGTTWDCVALVA